MESAWELAFLSTALPTRYLLTNLVTHKAILLLSKYNISSKAGQLIHSGTLLPAACMEFKTPAILGAKLQ